MQVDLLTAIDQSSWVFGPILAFSAVLSCHLSQRFAIWQCPGFPICSELNLTGGDTQGPLWK